MQMEDYERCEEEDEHWGIDHLKAEAAKDSSADKHSAAKTAPDRGSTALNENLESKARDL